MSKNIILRPIKFLIKNWPLTLSLIILWIIIGILFYISTSLNLGNFIYTLDDAYIHLAIAKNIFLHGIYGITQYGFNSSSSSIIWPIILSSIFYITGLNSSIPFILNIMFATIVIILVYYIFRSLNMSNLYILLILISLIILTPLTPLIFSGMEHLLQILLVIPFAYLSAVILSKEDIENKEIYLLVLLAIALTMVRYENFFLIIIVSLLFFLRRKFVLSFSLFGLALFPIIIYGIISTLHGWFFLPNSIIFKSTLQTDISSSNFLIGIINHMINQIIGNPVILILILLMFALIFLNYQKKKSFWNISSILAVIFLGTAFLHILFAEMGWFYRYEAYLVALGIFTFFIGFHKYIDYILSSDKSLIPKLGVLLIIVLIIFSPMIYRGFNSLVDTPLASNNIYDQHYQVGLFIKEYYNHQTVAIVDVGAVNYLADVKTLDLRGLTDFNISKHLQKGDYTTNVISDIVEQNNPRVIIVYDDLFKKYGGIPSGWIKVGEWKILNNVICEFDTISFYATNEEDKNRLIENLKNFSNNLPTDVEQRIFY